MEDKFNIQRFVLAHEQNYALALQEIKKGRKCFCWMWYIFPNIQGLGSSPTSRQYAISCLEEAKAYLANDYLRGNMQEICQALLELESCDPMAVVGHPDDMKLRSAMTLFQAAEPENGIYQAVLDKFFRGIPDWRTLKILDSMK